jgi:hypothetical protein
VGGDGCRSTASRQGRRQTEQPGALDPTIASSFAFPTPAGPQFALSSQGPTADLGGSRVRAFRTGREIARVEPEASRLGIPGSSASSDTYRCRSARGLGLGRWRRATRCPSAAAYGRATGTRPRATAVGENPCASWPKKTAPSRPALAPHGHALGRRCWVRYRGVGGRVARRPRPRPRRSPSASRGRALLRCPECRSSRCWSTEA